MKDLELSLVNERESWNRAVSECEKLTPLLPRNTHSLPQRLWWEMRLFGPHFHAEWEPVERVLIVVFNEAVSPTESVYTHACQKCTDFELLWIPPWDRFSSTGCAHVTGLLWMIATAQPIPLRRSS